MDSYTTAKNTTSTNIKQNKIEKRNVSPGSLTSQDINISRGFIVFPGGDYKLEFSPINNLDFLKRVINIKTEVKDELDRMRLSYIRYLIYSTQNHFRLRLATAPFPNWKLSLGNLTWSIEYARVLLAPFLLTNIYEQVRLLVALRDFAKHYLKGALKDGITPKIWEENRIKISTSNAVFYLPSPILGEFLLLKKGEDLDVFPFIPLIVPQFSNFDIDASNRADFLLDLASVLNPQTHLLARYTSSFVALGLGMLPKILSALLNPEELINFLIGGAMLGVGIVADWIDKKGAGAWDALTSIMKRPETLFMIKGPLLWRGSEAADWSCSASFSIPALLRVNLDGISGGGGGNVVGVPDDDIILNNLYLVDDREYSRADFLSLWTEAISRWFILPIRRYKQMQMFGWMCGFTATFKDANGRELYYWGVPDTWGNIDVVPKVGGGSIAQEFTISASGKAMIYGDMPDLVGLFTTLNEQFLRMARGTTVKG